MSESEEQQVQSKDLRWVINPKTDRRIKVGSATYKKLLKEGISFENEESPELGVTVDEDDAPELDLSSEHEEHVDNVQEPVEVDIIEPEPVDDIKEEEICEDSKPDICFDVDKMSEEEIEKLYQHLKNFRNI